MDAFIETIASMILAFLNGKHKLSPEVKRVLTAIKTTLDTTDLS